MEEAKRLFFELMSRYSNDESIANWEEIYKAYSHKSRHYHSFDHIINMLNELELVKDKVADLDTVLFAIYYHDIVYKSTKSNNELKSAELFKKRIAKTTFKEIDKCFDQIIATKDHKLSKENDTNILLDIDLWILGNSEEVYKIYYQNVRKEYSIYPDFLYNKGRAKVLKEMLSYESIFKTDYFISKYEEQAIVNLEKEILFLES